MQRTNFIKRSTIEEVKKHVQTLCDDKETIIVELRKTRTKIETYNVIIEGVYNKFFTVRDIKLKANFTIQYIDLITENTRIRALDEKEGD